RVLAIDDQSVALLRHDRRDQDLVGVKAHADPLTFPARASTTGSACSETSSERAQTIAATSSSAGVVTTTWARLRKDFCATSSSSATTTTSGSSLAHVPTRTAAT